MTTDTHVVINPSTEEEVTSVRLATAKRTRLRVSRIRSSLSSVLPTWRMPTATSSSRATFDSVNRSRASRSDEGTLGWSES